MVLNSVDYMLIFESGIANAGALRFGAHDAPPPAVWDKPHLASCSPPAVDLPWERHPELFCAAQFRKVSEQMLVRLLFLFTRDVIRVDDETSQTVFLKYEANLCRPKCQIILTKDVK